MSKMLKASVGLSLIGLGGSLLNMAAQMLLARAFGAGPELDAYFAALSVPLLGCGLVSGAIAYQVVPMLIYFDATGHPGVVLSHEDMLDDPKHHRFNVLMGSKKPPAASAEPRHVLLNEADGLEFVTLIDCGLVGVVRKPSILRMAGVVSWERRKEIQRKVRAYLGLG